MPQNTHRPNASLAGALLAGALFVCAVPTLAAERTWTETYDLGKDGSVSLSNINGDVIVRGSDRKDVRVVATISGQDDAALERVDVRASARGNRLEIETDYTKHKGRWGSHGWAEVEYLLEVPSSIELEEIDLVNGSLEISNISGDVETSLVNGNIEAEGLTGSVELSTVNGAMDVSFLRVGSDQRIEIESVNGPIEVMLPASVDADVRASTVHGKIRNDFGLEVEKGEYVGSDMKGILGSGGGRIRLENVNGSISLRRQ